MDQIFPESRHKSVIGYKEPLGKRISELEAHWIEQLYRQILTFKEKFRNENEPKTPLSCYFC
jgi:hypothetical protein